MIEISNVGKQPALRRVMNCPFCSYERRGISLNVGIVPSARVLYPGGLTVEIHKHAEQRLFVFGSNGKPWPCPHVILAWGVCTWQPSGESGGIPPQALEFDMEHPCLTQTDHEIEVFLKEQVATRACDKRFLPSLPVRYRQVQKKWHQRPDVENPARDFEFQMRAYFTPDVVKLFTELPAKAEAYWQHCAKAEAAAAR